MSVMKVTFSTLVVFMTSATCVMAQAVKWGTGLFGELNAIIGQNGMDKVRHHRQQVLQQRPCRFPVSLIDELRERKLTGLVDANE